MITKTNEIPLNLTKKIKDTLTEKFDTKQFLDVISLLSREPNPVQALDTLIKEFTQFPAPERIVHHLTAILSSFKKSRPQATEIFPILISLV